MNRVFNYSIILILVSLSLGAQNTTDQHRYCATLNQLLDRLDQKTQHIAVADTFRAFQMRSPGGKFLVHWDETGTNAVPSADISANGVPDYVDSAMVYLDTAWEEYINQMGYAAPPNEHGLPASTYSIFFTDFPYYGLTTATGVDIPALPGTNWSSYLELENDYAESYFFSRGLEGLKVTVAHEFHHAIQFGYNVRSQDFFYYEMTSTWLEDYFYDDVNDYIQYLDSFYSNIGNYSFDSFIGLYPYGNSIYLHMTDKKFGPGFVKNTWDEIKNQSALNAISRVLENPGYGSSWGISLAEYGRWLWFTGARSDNYQFFDEGDLYPQVQIPVENTFEFADSLNKNIFVRGNSSKFIRLTAMMDKAVISSITSLNTEHPALQLINGSDISEIAFDASEIISNPAETDELILIITNYSVSDATVKLNVKLIENFVLLDNFEARPLTGKNQVSWQSVFEILNKEWILMRKKSGETIELIRFPGKEYSKNTSGYQYLDYDVQPGETYDYLLAVEYKNGEKEILDSVKVAGKIPDQIELLPNFPNPFNAQTKLIVSTAGNQKFDLKIYDSLGKLIRILTNKNELTAGNYEYFWDGRNLNQIPVASGIYFAILNSDRNLKTIKMILLR